MTTAEMAAYAYDQIDQVRAIVGGKDADLVSYREKARRRGDLRQELAVQVWLGESSGKELFCAFCCNSSRGS